VHQVGYQPVQQGRVAGDRGRFGVLSDQDAVGRRFADRLAYQDVEVHRLRGLQPVLSLGEDEQAVDQPLVAPVDLEQFVPHPGKSFRGGIVQADFDCGPLNGQRGTQFVRGVGDESALAVHGSLDAFQHAVESIG